MSFNITAKKLKAMMKSIKKMASDAQSLQRAEKRMCSACFYLHLPSKVGFMAFSEKKCATNECETMIRSSSSILNKICSDCADRKSACAHCGCDMEEINEQVEELKAMLTKE